MVIFSFVSVPFLKCGDYICFLSNRGVPCWREAWNRSVPAGESSAAVSLSTLVGIPSGPVALYGFSLDKSLLTPLTVIVMFGVEDMGLDPCRGGGNRLRA